MKINKNNISSIRDQIRISDVISNFIDIKKKGQNYQGICPFHDDKHPSLVVNDSKNIFKCFSCGVSGDVFAFVAKFKNINYYQAIAECAKICNLDEKIISSAIKFNEEYNRNYNYYEINKYANHFFTKFIKTDEGSNAINYLLNRRFTDEEIKLFEIGWAPDSNIVYDLLTNKNNCSSGKTNFNNFDLEIVGLTNKDNFFFKNRITFPIYDEYNNIVGFSARTIDKSEPKYVNTQDTPIFHKNEILFNLNNVINNIETESIYLVEGFMDVFAFRRLNINNVVATMGVAFTKSHLEILKSKLPNLKIINVFYDNDDAGKKATDTVLKLIGNTYIAFVSNYIDNNYKDIDEIYTDNKDLALNTINSLISSEQYQINQLINKYKPLNESNKILFINNCLDILSHSKNDIAVDNCINNICDLLCINKEILIDKINKNYKPINTKYNSKKYNFDFDVDINPSSNTKELKSITIDDLEKTIIQFFLIDKNNIELYSRKRFINEENEIILNSLLQFYANNHNVTSIRINDLSKIFNDEKIISCVCQLLLENEKHKIANSQKALQQTIDTYLKKLNQRWQQKQLEKIKNSSNPSDIIKESINRNKNNK